MKQWIVKMSYGATYLVHGWEESSEIYGKVLRGDFRLLRSLDGSLNDIRDDFVSCGAFPKNEIVELFELT